MTETISVPLDLIPTPLFRKKYNVSYSDSDFDGTNKWEIVIATVCPDNLNDCLDSSGVLTGVTVADSEDISLNLTENGNIGCYVTIKNNVTMSLDSDVDVKGLFLRKKSNNFILMGMVNQKPMRFCDGMTFEKDNVLFVIEG